MSFRSNGGMPPAAADAYDKPNRRDIAPPRPRGISTRAILALLTIGLSIPLLGFSGYLIYREGQAERARYEAELRQTANQLSLVINREFSFLVTLLEAMASSPAMVERDFAKFHEQATNLKGLPGVNITLRDAQGRMLVNARVAYGDQQSNFVAVLDHDYAVIDERRPVMSNVYFGVTRGAASVSAAIPILDDASVAYILQVNLPTSHFADLLQSFRLTGDVDAFIVDRNGVFVAQSSNHAATTGTKYSFSDRVPAQDGLIRAIGPNGVVNVGVLATSTATGWRVGVMAPRQKLQEPTRRALGSLAIMGIACAGIGLLAAVAIGREISSSIHALASAGEALQRNEPREFRPTRLREVNEVAKFLDEAGHQVRVSELRLRESEAWLQEALRAGHAFAFDLDVASDTLSFSGGGAELLGYSGEQPFRIDGRAFRSRIHSDDFVRVLAEARKATPESPGISMRFRYARREAGYLWLVVRATARFDARGALAQVAGLAVDMTASALAEEAQARLAAIVETSPDMIISVAPGGDILTWNSGAERMFGYTAEEAVGKSLKMLVPADIDDFDDLVSRMRVSGSLLTETVRLTKDGRRIDVRISAGSVRLPDGARGSSAIFTDITERKRFEEQQRTLINELNHRVKNTIATIQSIAAHTFRDPGDHEAMQSFVDRLIALSQAHNVLTDSSWEGADIADIVGIAIAPHQMKGRARFRVSGPSLSLQPRGALALSMALHELCTNAAKYGALSNATGVVAIDWSVGASEAGTRLRMEWRESGGPPVVKPEKSGFGTRLVRATLTDDLEAQVELDFDSGGVVCSFETVLPNPAGRRTPAHVGRPQ